MSERHQLSLTSAIMINLNIMLGVGLFINTTELAQRAGALGAFSYIIIGVLLLPLILSIVQLLQQYPTGGFYTFGQKAINPFAGFLSAWSYFTGKLSSAILAIHIFVRLIQPMFPLLAPINPLILDAVLLCVIIGLNMLNLKIGSSIQTWLMVVKISPIIFLVLTGLFFLQGNHLGTAHQVWSGIPSTIPLVLHAMLGFEAACSLSSKIKNAPVNAPRAVLISYGLIIAIYCLYQFIFYGVLGGTLAAMTNYQHAFPALFQTVVPFTNQALLENIAHIAIATSALSGAFGMIFSNMWNLHIIAENNHTFFSKLFARLNRHHVPTFCVLAEGLICLLYLAITYGDQVSLQQISALGCTLAYTISVLSLLVICLKQTKGIWLPLFGLVNCAILISSCVYNLWQTSTISLHAFTGILLFGTVMFWVNKQKHKPNAALR